MKLPCIIFWVLAGAPLFGFSQHFSPKWYGRAETKTRSSYNTYLCEMVIYKKGNKFTGTMNYYFGRQEHQVNISGIYWPQTKTFELNPFNLISYFARESNSPDCQVDGSLTLYSDGGDSVLYGQLNPVSQYRNMCPVLTISLHKETLPDPGGDPDLPLATGQAVSEGDSIFSDKSSGLRTGEEGAGSKESNISAPPNEPLKGRPDSTSTNINATMPLISAPVASVTLAEFNKRIIQEGPLFQAETDTITLHLYDNGQVDNDTVTLFFNRKPVVFRQKLGLSPIILKLVLQPGENEIAMFAENLGDIPPNTALCLLYSGQKRYEINLVSNLASNGTVRIKGPEKTP